jgi:activator of HSP90 ATPase
MTPVIQQRVRVRTSARTLFDLYLDSRCHSLSTGAPATFRRKAGGKFKAFGGQLEGKHVLIVPGEQIVQLGRATHWKKADWSILILTFSAAEGGAQVDLVHVGVPAYDHKGVSKGWPQYYWRPWKKYLTVSPLRSSSPSSSCHTERSLRSEESIPRQRTAQFPACPR